MGFLLWMSVLGGILLVLALTSSALRWMPITTSAACLVMGIAMGPAGLGWLQLDLHQASSWMEHLSEVAVLFSLFVCGLKLRLPLKDPSWRVAFGLAGPVMLLSIAATGMALHYLLGLPWGAAVLVASILAPTDPVLASMVQVNDSRDHDRVRFGLSGEAGLNDGVAFPFVLLGLAMLQAPGSTSDGWLEWLCKDLVWAVPAGLLIGYGMGRGLGRLTLLMQTRNRDSTSSPNDYLTLALIALAYVIAEALQGYGFLSVFAAALGLRRSEVLSSDSAKAPAEHLVQPVVGHQNVEPHLALHGDVDALEEAQVAAGVMMGDMLAFGNLVERAMEVFLVTLLGVVIVNYWDGRAVIIGALLFLVIRPSSVLLLPWGPLLQTPQRWLVGWFGIRGIGSLYYLFYALNHGLDADLAGTCVGLTLSVVALSILIHGLSTQPMLARYERLRAKQDDA
ncbi:cation:proton antiporter [Pseudomonas asplenii]|uniref:cation:proton antiporter n=1 Tax=Pseudomonas asplenii TaxID=53407 RepID=UPI0023607D2B|nr:sodium:proton antiporter [Pseudomonas asplenii]